MSDTTVQETEIPEGSEWEIQDGDPDLLKFYKKISFKIAEIDSALDAGTESAGKRKVTNDLVESSKAVWESVASHLVENIKARPTMEQTAGVYYGIIRQLVAAFKDDVEKFVSEQVVSAPADGEVPSDDEKKLLQDTRRDLNEQVKKIVDLATHFGLVDPENPWKLPPRRGAVGKRGQRALTSYVWLVDGNEFEDNDSVKGVSQYLGFEKTADFTAALKENEVDGKKFDTKTPPPEFTFTIRGKEVTGMKAPVSEDEDSDTDEPGETEE